MQRNLIPDSSSAKRPRVSSRPVHEPSIFKPIFSSLASLCNQSDATDGTNQSSSKMGFTEVSSIGDLLKEREDVQHQVSNPKDCSSSPRDPSLIIADSSSFNRSGYTFRHSEKSGTYNDVFYKNQASELRVSKRSKWTKEENERLKACMKEHGPMWKRIMTYFPNKSEHDCQKRWASMKYNSIKRNHGTECWSKEEDEKLITLVAKYGTSWKFIAQYFEHSRLAKHCRERWKKHLDPSINKAPWTEEENYVLYHAHKRLGARWATIAKLLPGRTVDAMKEQLLLMKQKIIKTNKCGNTKASDLNVNSSGCENNITEPRGNVIRDDENPTGKMDMRDVMIEDVVYVLDSDSEEKNDDTSCRLLVDIQPQHQAREFQLSSQDDPENSNASTLSQDEIVDHQDIGEGEVRVGKIAFRTDLLLGKGCEGANVYRGTVDNRDVAVKRLLSGSFRFSARVAELLRDSYAHANVVKYYCIERDGHFTYIALDLCSATLQDYVENRLDFECSIDSIEILRQATMGLCHLHALDIVHGNMKPRNVLLSTPSGAGGVRAVISDYYSLSGKSTFENTTFFRRSWIMSTDGWIAPEMFDGKPTTTSVDIFSLGCMFYYALSKGHHPFGDELKRLHNIRIGDYVLNRFDSVLLKTNLDDVKVLIRSMISSWPRSRPTCAAVLKHPTFWGKHYTLQKPTRPMNMRDARVEDVVHVPDSDPEKQNDDARNRLPVAMHPQHQKPTRQMNMRDARVEDVVHVPDSDSEKQNDDARNRLPVAMHPQHQNPTRQMNMRDARVEDVVHVPDSDSEKQNDNARNRWPVAIHSQHQNPTRQMNMRDARVEDVVHVLDSDSEKQNDDARNRLPVAMHPQHQTQIDNEVGIKKTKHSTDIVERLIPNEAQNVTQHGTDELGSGTVKNSHKRNQDFEDLIIATTIIQLPDEQVGTPSILLDPSKSSSSDQRQTQHPPIRVHDALNRDSPQKVPEEGVLDAEAVGNVESSLKQLLQAPIRVHDAPFKDSPQTVPEEGALDADAVGNVETPIMRMLSCMCPENLVADKDTSLRADTSRMDAAVGKWTEEEDERLIAYVKGRNDMRCETWTKVADQLPSRSQDECRQRWMQVLRPRLVHDAWTREDDQKLLECVARYGPEDWTAITRYIHWKKATQCRERWHNHLVPFIRKNASTEQSELVNINLQLEQLCNQSTKVAKLLPGRPAVAVKKHQNSSRQKKSETEVTKSKSKRKPKNRIINTSGVKVVGTICIDDDDEPQHRGGCDKGPSTDSTPSQLLSRMHQFITSFNSSMFKVNTERCSGAQDAIGAQTVENIENPPVPNQIFLNGKRLLPLLKQNLHQCTECLLNFTSQEELSSHIDAKHSKIENIRDKFVFEDDTSDDDDFETCNDEDILSDLMNEPEENSSNSNISVDQKDHSNNSSSSKGNNNIHIGINGFCEIQGGLNFTNLNNRNSKLITQQKDNR